MAQEKTREDIEWEGLFQRLPVEMYPRSGRPAIEAMRRLVSSAEAAGLKPPLPNGVSPNRITDRGLVGPAPKTPTATPAALNVGEPVPAAPTNMPSRFLPNQPVGYVDPGQPDKGKTATWDESIQMWRSDRGALIRDDAIRATPGPTTPASPSPASPSVAAPAAPSPMAAAAGGAIGGGPLAGLQAAAPTTTAAPTTAAAPTTESEVENITPMTAMQNPLRQGLGRRLYPDISAALAGLKRIY